MLLNAMEIGGLDGRFRTTCERVIRSLRSNRDAIVATLETFVYDPLMTWRLLAQQHTKLERILKASAMSAGPEIIHSAATQMIPSFGATPKVPTSTTLDRKLELTYHEVVAKAIPHCNKCRSQFYGNSTKRHRCPRLFRWRLQRRTLPGSYNAQGRSKTGDRPMSGRKTESNVLPFDNATQISRRFLTREACWRRHCAAEGAAALSTEALLSNLSTNLQDTTLPARKEGPEVIEEEEWEIGTGEKTTFFPF